MSKNLGRPTHLNSLEIEASEGLFAPLKLKEGTHTTSPEKGAIEYHDGHLHFTPETERYTITLANSVVTSNTTVTNTTTETALFSKTFPADSFHEDYVVRLSLYGSISNSSASDDYTIKYKLGGTTLHTLTRVGGNVSDNGWVLTFVLTIRVTGSSGEFLDFTEFREASVNQSFSEITTHSVDTTSDQLLEITVTWDNAKADNTITASQGFLEFIH